MNNSLFHSVCRARNGACYGMHVKALSVTTFFLFFAAFSLKAQTLTLHQTIDNQPITKSSGDLFLVAVSPTGDTTFLTGLPEMNLNQSPQSETDALGCHCFGKIMDCLETGAIGNAYPANCNTSHHRGDCCNRVKNFISNLSAAEKKRIEACLCSKNLADNTSIYATSAIGTQSYESCSGAIATYHRKPPYSVTTCVCPAGWLANATNVDGGVTTDGKCKKGVCGPWSSTAFPPPPNGTPIGTWGFTWGTGIYAWGTTANGGVATCTTIQHPAGPCLITWH
jgi:hypothetical protein